MTTQLAEKIFTYVERKIGFAFPLQAAEDFIISAGKRPPIPKDILYKMWAGGNVELLKYYTTYQEYPDVISLVFRPAAGNLERNPKFYDSYSF